MRKFLEFIELMNQINVKFFLSEYEIKMLDLVARAHISHNLIRIRELIYHPSIASQATLHAAVKKLVDKKLLVTKRDERDGRSKTAALTKLALGRYAELNHAMRYQKIT